MSIIKPSSGVDDRVKLAKVIPLNTPFTIGIYPSNICNFKCIYCVQSLNKNILRDKYNFKKELMNMETFKKIIDQIKKFPSTPKLMTFMGQGEPLINYNLSEMIKIAKESKIASRVDVVTNASLLTHQKSEELIKSGLDVLRISLQGLTSEKYKNISNVNISFDELLANISYFYEISRNKCKLYVKIMNASLDKGQEELFYKTFDLITDRMYIEQIKPVYDGIDYNNFDFSLETDRRGIKHEKRYVCPQPFFTLSIWPNGDVIPCSAIHKVCYLGNVNSNELINMWNSRDLKNFQIMHLKKLRYTHPQCKLCCAPDDCAHPEDDIEKEAKKLSNNKYYVQ